MSWKFGNWFKSLFRLLIRNADSAARFNMLTCSLYEYLSLKQREQLFRTEFEKRKKDDWSMAILAEVLLMMLADLNFKNGTSRMRKYIHFFVHHKNFKVRKFGIMASPFVDPIDPGHLQALRRGLFHTNYTMQLCCVNSLIHIASLPMSEEKVRLLNELRFRTAIERVILKSPKLAENARIVLEQFEKRAVIK